jgi:hypothetical protein
MVSRLVIAVMHVVVLAVSGVYMRAAGTLGKSSFARA